MTPCREMVTRVNFKIIIINRQILYVCVCLMGMYSTHDKRYHVFVICNGMTTST